MKTEFIIQDISVKYVFPQNIIEEGLLYRHNTPIETNTESASQDTGSNETASIAPYSGSIDAWTKRFDFATKFSDSKSAIEVATRLHSELPVRILSLEINGNQINVELVKFP